MNTFVAKGNRIPWTNSTGSTVASGTLVSVETGTSGFAGIAVTDIANGATGEVAVSGEHRVAKAAGAISYGAKVYITSATITARGALIYNSSDSNKAVLVLDFGGDKISTAGTFTIQFPAATSSDAIIRIS
jgi:predicted RecA/RadA family phage recombinase